MLYSTGPRCRLLEWLTPALWCHTLKLFVGWATSLLDLLALDEHFSLLSYSISDREKKPTNISNRTKSYKWEDSL